MGQITEDFARRMIAQCKRGEHPPLTVWEAEQLAHAWLKLDACRPILLRYEWLRENPAWETEMFLGGLTPEEFDEALDAAMKDG